MSREQMSFFPVEENQKYLTEQIITYLGNKRSLLSFIGMAVDDIRRELGREKLDIADLFSGSGVVSRYFKGHARTLYVNDLEQYCQRINRCYLTNADSVDHCLLDRYFQRVRTVLEQEPLRAGFITRMYSPEDDASIKAGERVFYTTRNAMYIDTARQLLEEIPEPYQTFLLAPLLYEASVHNNTSGVFKGFYKNSKTGIGQYGGDGRNALTRILGDIQLKKPVFSRFSCDVHLFQQDANLLAEQLPEVDLAYLDPPYNQHPYGSNYFMLNLIDSYRCPHEVSTVSGIPKAWNKSAYNKKQTAGEAMFDLCSRLKANYLLISFNSEGFISKEEMVSMLEQLGEVKVFDKEHNTFRGSRNLSNREIHVTEYLYLVRKN